MFLLPFQVLLLISHWCLSSMWETIGAHLLTFFLLYLLFYIHGLTQYHGFKSCKNTGNFKTPQLWIPDMYPTVFMKAPEKVGKTIPALPWKSVLLLVVLLSVNSMSDIIKLFRLKTCGVLSNPFSNSFFNWLLKSYYVSGTIQLE